MQTHLPPGAPLRHGKLLPARPATQKVWSLPLLLCFLLSYDKFSWPFQTKDQTSLSFYYSNLNNVFVFLNFFPSQKSISCSDFRSDFSSLCSVLELLTHLVRRPLSVTFSPSLSAKILSYAWLASPLLRSAHLVGGGGARWGHGMVGLCAFIMCPWEMAPPIHPCAFISFPMKIFLPCLFHKAC